MFSEFLEGIEKHYQANLPFVVYRRPNDAVVKAIFQATAELGKVKSYREEGFVFAPFDTKTPPLLLKRDKIDTAVFPMTTDTILDYDDLGHHASEAGKESHMKLVTKGIKQIQQGRFQKVVLSRAIKTKGHANPIFVFQKLLARYANAFCYLWYHPKVGLWMGATPEQLLKLENGIITTNSLAGTQSFKGNLEPSWGNKELEEQQLVTDYINDALTGLVSDIKISPVSTIRAGNLLHLKTSIHGKADRGLLPNIITGLHPTPAVCGLPRGSSMDFILENENYDRRFYTGFLGELNLSSEAKRSADRRNVENGAYRSFKKTTELFVNLRCVRLSDAKATVYVGGGVTKDSDPEREWEETVNKSRTILNVLYAK